MKRESVIYLILWHFTFFLFYMGWKIWASGSGNDGGLNDTMKEEALKGKLYLHLLFTKLFFCPFTFFFPSCTMAYEVDDLAEKPSKA